jgi:glucuronate isomerase
MTMFPGPRFFARRRPRGRALSRLRVALPIIDFHTHLPPAQIATNHRHYRDARMRYAALRVND